MKGKGRCPLGYHLKHTKCVDESEKVKEEERYEKEMRERGKKSEEESKKRGSDKGNEVNLSKDFLEDFIRKEVFLILSGSQSTQGASRGNGDGRKNSQTDMFTMLGR